MESGQEDVALIRLEQLYPFPKDEFIEVIKPFSGAKEVVWCQEEPRNQGAFRQIKHRLSDALKETHPKVEVEYVGRISSAAPACGYMSVHLEEQKQFVTEALSVK